MSSSFEKYIKAAIENKKYSVVCEMANVIHPEKNNINIMTYPGNDIRIYKNREDEVQVLCPKNITTIQESNLTKAIETGTIFDNADEVDNYSDFIVNTRMPVNAMVNKGLEHPYKLKEVVGSTIGVMDDNGDVEVSDTDIENGRNVIDDLLDKDSKEFKDVKNVVDDYLDNEDHDFGYDNDFTYDIQQLRDEINAFKDADISPEDSITDADWDDNWGSTSSIMGDHNEDEDDTNPDKEEDDDEVSDDDDDQDENEDITQEAANISNTPPAYKLKQSNEVFGFLKPDTDKKENTDSTDVDYKVKEECGDGCMNNNPSAGGNVNVTMENDSMTEKPNDVNPKITNNTTGEPTQDNIKDTDIEKSNNLPPDVSDTTIPSGVKMESFQEGFGLLRPKKLKAIPIRDIVSYVTVEMNAIKDSNDQAMLAGYVCSKLELIDFYITVLDTHDNRYVVPHTRDYLVNGQKQLSDLLTQILKIKPINKSDRLWKALV